jgi:hypothetical protein
MKRKLMVITAIILCLTLTLTACGGGGNNNDNISPPPGGNGQQGGNGQRSVENWQQFLIDFEKWCEAHAEIIGSGDPALLEEEGLMEEAMVWAVGLDEIYLELDLEARAIFEAEMERLNEKYNLFADGDEAIN